MDGRTMPKANPLAIIIDDYLDQMIDGIRLLATCPTRLTNKRNDAARLLCQLSRDAVFTMRLISEYDVSYVVRMVAVFRSAAAAITGNTDLIHKYKARIRERADVLLGKLEAAGSRVDEATIDHAVADVQITVTT